MRQISKILIVGLLVMVFVVPVFSFAQDGTLGTGENPLVPCGRGNDGCDFGDLLQLAKNIIDFSIFYLAIPIATLSFAFAGVMLIISPGNEARRNQAKEVFYYAFIGLVIALSAWLIVDTILDALVDDSTREQIENINA